MAKELHSRISALTTAFVDAVLDAVRGSSLQELIGGRSARTEAHAPRPTAPRAASTATRAAAGGRLPRRSAEDIAKVLEVVVSLLGSRKSGLRAEQIRTELNLQAKELPRILKEGLDRKKIRAMGQKRATTYFANMGRLGK